MREALRKLAPEGWLRIVPDSGTWVASPTKREIVNAYEVREKLERWSIEKAVPYVTPLVLDRPEEALAKEHAVYENKINPERYTGINCAFHLIIAETGGNSVLTQHIRSAITYRYFIWFFNDYLDFANSRSLREHEKPVGFLHDIEQASAMIATHVQNGFHDLKLPDY